MPTPSLAQIVLEEIEVIRGLLPEVLVNNGDRSRQALWLIHKSLAKAETMAERRATASDREAIRRRQEELLKDIAVCLPPQRG